MSLKVIIFILVIVLIIAGFSIFSLLRSSKTVLQPKPAVNSVASSVTSNGQGNGNDKLTSSVNDTSNAALNSDLSAIDNQMQELGTDVKNVDQSLNQ